MSIQNSTRQDLNLENFKKLQKSINSFIVTPLIYFRLDQVSSIKTSCKVTIPAWPIRVYS